MDLQAQSNIEIIEDHLKRLENSVVEQKEFHRTFPTTWIGQYLDRLQWREARIALIASIVALLLSLLSFLSIAAKFLQGS
jgi:hypothetical protein